MSRRPPRFTLDPSSAASDVYKSQALYLGKVNGRNRAYGIARLLVPFEQAMPVLERDITAAINAGMVELVEVPGPQPVDAN